MPASVVQARGVSGSGVTSVGVTLSSGVTAGNLLYAAVRTGIVTSSGAHACTDSAGNSYTVRNTNELSTSPSLELTDFTAVANATGSLTVTFGTSTGGSLTFHGIVAEVTGQDAATPYHTGTVTASLVTGSTTTAVPSVTTTADALLLSFVAASGDSTITVPTGYTSVGGTGVPTTRAHMAYKAAGSAGTYGGETWGGMNAVDRTGSIHVAIASTAVVGSTGAPAARQQPRKFGQFRYRGRRATRY